MADITFPSNPVNGQEYLAQNGFVYVWNSSKGVWNKKGNFVRPPKVLTVDGYSPNTSGIITQSVTAAVTVGVDSYKAYTTLDSFPNYTEYQFSTNSGFTTVSYATTTTARSISLTGAEIPSGSDVWVRARQFVGSSAASAPIGGISTYSRQPIKFTTASTALFTPSIVSIAGTTSFPVYQIGFAATTLPATATYTGAGSPGNLRQVDWRVTGPRIPTSTGDTALAEVGVGTHSSATLANALVLAMPFSGATGVGITNDVNNAIRTASGASAGTTKTFSITGTASTTSIAGLALTSHFYPCAAFFDGSSYISNSSSNTDYNWSNGDYTAECWFYLRSSSDQFIMGNWSSSSNSRWGIYTYLGSIYFTGGTKSILTPVSTNSWQHVAMIVKNQIVYLFLNGILVGTESGLSAYTQVNNNFSVGRYTDSNVGYLNGYLQDLKIYKGLAKYTENFTPPLPTYGTLSYTTGTTYTGINTTAFFESTGDIPTAEASSTAANALVLAMPMNRTFGFQDINVAIRGLTTGASAGTAKTVGLGTTSTANAPSHPRISSTESKWYDGAGYFDGGDYVTVPNSSDLDFGAGNFTIEFWANSQSSANHWIMGKGDAGTVAGSTLSFYTGVVWDFYYNGSSGLSLTPPTYTNQWTHIAVVRNSTIISIYRNGVLFSSGTIGTGTLNSTSNNLQIGQYSSTGITGYIQDFKIYKGFAKYTANFTPPQPICGFTTDISTQTGFTTTTATGSLLSSVVGLGSTSTLAFSADTYINDIRSSGITTLPDVNASILELALPLANIVGVGTTFTNDRTPQIRSVSGVTINTAKTIEVISPGGISVVSSGSTNVKFYDNVTYFSGIGNTNSIKVRSGLGSFSHTGQAVTIEGWFNLTSASLNDSASNVQQLFGKGNRTADNLGSQYEYAVGIYNSRFYAVSSPDGTYSSGNVEIYQIFDVLPNTWYHVAVVLDGTGPTNYILLFVNGNFITRSNYGGGNYTPTDALNTSLPFCIGSIGPATRSFEGYVQDFKVYKGAPKYTYLQNFKPPSPSFGNYTFPKLFLSPASDYVLEVKNTSTNSYTTAYSSTRQWGTKPKGGIYDPYGSNLVLAIPGNNTTGVYDVTGQIKYETPTATYAPYRYSSTNGLNINRAVDGVIANSSTTNLAGTVTFATGISYNNLLVVYGNMANGSLGNPASGATLSVNGSNVTATGTYGLNGYSSSYTKYYETNTPGTLNSVGITAGVGGSHESGIYEIYVNNSPLLASLDSTSITGGNYTVTSPTGITTTNKMVNIYGNSAISATQSKYYGRSIYFDGTEDYLIVPSNSDFALPSDFTIECWYYANSFTGLHGIFNIGAYNTGTMIRLSTTYGYEVYVNGTQYTTGAGTAKLTTWTHLSVVRKNGIISLYENGIFITSWSNSGSIAQNNITIGAAAHALSTETLNGYLQDIRLYKGVAKYTSNFTPPNQIWFS